MISIRHLVRISTVAIALLAPGGGAGVALAQCQAQELVKLGASDGISMDLFGHSVAMDGDLAVIGAWEDDTLVGSAGAAYVFRYDGATWAEEAILFASDPGPRDYFGVSVGVSGDTIVVGAYLHNLHMGDEGSAYVFVFDGTRWGQVAKLTASDAWEADRFGYSVAIDGDRIVAGAYLDDDGGINSGSAYVFEKPSGGWTDMHETFKLTSSDAETNDEFGRSVSISGETVVVGAHHEAPEGDFLAGSAYVFQLDGPTCSQVAKLTASDAADSDRLGLSVAVDGDVAVVGAWGNDDGGSSSGSAYVFVKPAGGWTDTTETAKLSASDAATGDRFGHTLDVDGEQVVVGGPAHDFDGDGFGAAYVFWRPAGGWTDMTETARFAASDGVQDDDFALSVAVGGSRFLAGAEFHDFGGVYATGAAYVHGGLSDCQPNGLLDACDLAGGSSADDNGNGVPDECEAQGEGAGSVEASLRVDHLAGDLLLSWDDSCLVSDGDYEIYEGSLGDFTSHAARLCGTGGETQVVLTPDAGSAYYIVVPAGDLWEGSYGLDSDGLERPDGLEACLPRFVVDCP